MEKLILALSPPNGHILRARESASSDGLLIGNEPRNTIEKFLLISPTVLKHIDGFLRFRVSFLESRRIAGIVRRGS